MNRRPYNSYRGRKSLGQRILMGVAVVLAVVLLLTLVFLFVLYNNFDFRDAEVNRPQPTAQPSQEAEPTLIIETPAPSAAPSPAPGGVDLTDLPPRRTAPQGLIPYQEGAALGTGQGFLFTAQQADDFTPDTAQNDYGYAAVYLDAAQLEGEELAERCQALAALGVDELVVAGDVDAKALREALPAETYHGYLSVVAGKFPFQNDTAQGRDLARYCDRVYVPGGDWGGLNLYAYLTDNGFAGSHGDIVTIVTAPLSVSWSWAILPSPDEPF